MIFVEWFIIIKGYGMRYLSILYRYIGIERGMVYGVFLLVSFWIWIGDFYGDKCTFDPEILIMWFNILGIPGFYGKGIIWFGSV